MDRPHASRRPTPMGPSEARRELSSSTIRAVTPESIPEGAAYVSSPPPMTPRGPGGANPRSFMTRANSTDADFMRSANGMRPRTRTMEERSSRERAPSDVFVPSRHRIGSVHSALDDTVVSSIGHPSVTPALPPRTSSVNRPRGPKEPARTSSPVPVAGCSQSDVWVDPLATPDRDRLVELMATTRGQMQGRVLFRRSEVEPWCPSYCYINKETGSLVHQPQTDSSPPQTLVPDLRGCTVRSGYDAETYMAFVHVMGRNSSVEVSLRPSKPDEFHSWFAALLAWTPMPPKGIHNKMVKPQAPLAPERRLADRRRLSEASLSVKDPPVIKVGKMTYWDPLVPFHLGTSKPATGARPQAFRAQSHGPIRSRRVSCQLRENGELKLYTENDKITNNYYDTTVLIMVQLSELSRCAIQRLDRSVLDHDFCIAIYPQYSSSSSPSSLRHPIFLSLESRVLYEVWVVLLRAFTIPQLYGPKRPHSDDGSPPASRTQDMFRMERSLFFRVVEARLQPPIAPKPENGDSNRSSGPPVTLSTGGYYIAIQLDGETRARTIVKAEGVSPFWREEFEFQDVPATTTTASLLLQKRHMYHTTRLDKEKQDTLSVLTRQQQANVIDQIYGKADIYLEDLGPTQDVEKWWPLVNIYGNPVGEVLVKVSTEESVILMARDYQPLSELLHKFENGLTMQIAQMVPNELKRLSECLLNIFQVSGEAIRWISSLVEEEIDGTLKETPASRLRFSKRMGSQGSEFDRELVVRDMGKHATLEANLLFRGNTLLTKALDFHMKRLGKEYLEDTLAEKLREINDRDYECEVDPNRVEGKHDRERNWRRLLNLTEDVWRVIYHSASRCPQELRLIFRHIRACAEDRFGGYSRTVQHSSVSGFLFLRFFVPAVLNPKLFGLLKDHPKPHARRTLTLIAKGLQGLANMTTFGTKEAWMEPMNEFLKSHREEFKTYLDNICSISSSASHSAPIPPSYSTPLAILQRLPPTSREGFPSLPYLIDHARNFAALVGLWLEHTRNTAPNIKDTDGDLLRFHNICVSLQRRTKDCLNRAEEAERPSSPLSGRWEEAVEQLQGVAPFEPARSKPIRAQNAHNSSASMPISPSGSASNGQNLHDDVEDDDSSEGTNTPMTMKTTSRTPTRHRHASSISAPQSSVTSASSQFLSNPFSRKEGKARVATPSGSFVSASASASASVSAAEEETPPGSSDGLHFPPHPPYAYPPPSSNFSQSTSSMSGKANVPLNLSHISTQSKGMQPPRSAGGYSYDGSEAGSDEVTTALPVFDKEKEKERKERGLQKILPFKSRRKKEEKEKDKEKEREKEREKEKEKERQRDRECWRDREFERGGYERAGSALGDYRENTEF